MEADEEGTLELLNALRRALVDPKIAEHCGRIVKTTGDGLLVEFGSVVDALRCATEVQAAMTERNADVPEDHRIEFRIDINMGDIVVEEGDIFGDGVNVAARLEGLAQRGGVCVSARVQEDAAGKLDLAFENTGEQQLRNIARPVRVYQVVSISRNAAVKPPLALPDKPSLAVLPFQHLSGDREQEYFADGVVEEIITAISRLPWLFVIARNSSFAYKGKSPDLRQVGRELGVRYVLEGSARKAGSRVRITGQLIDTTTGAHIWADHFDGALDDIFELRDQIASSVVGAIEPKLRQSEIERAARKPTESLDACDLYLRALALRHQYTETHSRGDGPARTSIGNRPVLRARGSDDRFLPGPPKSTRLRTGFGYPDRRGGAAGETSDRDRQERSRCPLDGRFHPIVSRWRACDSRERHRPRFDAQSQFCSRLDGAWACIGFSRPGPNDRSIGSCDQVEPGRSAGPRFRERIGNGPSGLRPVPAGHRMGRSGIGRTAGLSSGAADEGRFVGTTRPHRGGPRFAASGTRARTRFDDRPLQSIPIPAAHSARNRCHLGGRAPPGGSARSVGWGASCAWGPGYRRLPAGKPGLEWA
jgi:TolB-like protein